MDVNGSKVTYAEKLKDPRWQKKRLLILERDNWSCRYCGSKDKTLNIHHLYYEKGNPWEIDDEGLMTLCETCHEFESKHRATAEAEILSAFRKTGFSTMSLCVIANSLRLQGLNTLTPALLNTAIRSKSIMKIIERRYIND